MNSNVSELIEQGTSETVEFFDSTASAETVARAVCAMLNQHGGVIVWGVNSFGQVTGFDHPDDRAGELQRIVGESLTPLPLFSVSVQRSGQRQLIAIDVPRGADKPYSFRREIWVRVGSSTLRASTEQSAQMVQQSASRLSRWERELVPGFSIEDCDSIELQISRNEILASGRFGVSVPLDDEDLLRRLGLTLSGQLTNAAVVLFAERPREWAPNLSLRIVAYPTDKLGDITHDHILDGPAIRVLKEAVTLIQQLTGFSGAFRRSQLQRTDSPTYPLFVLREALVNAMVHCDYSIIGGGAVVEVFPNRLVVRNPGQLPEGWTVADLSMTHGSQPKNPDIARVFYLRAMMEQLGVGTQKMIEESRAVGAREPVWDVRQRSVSLTLFPARTLGVSAPLSDRQRRFLETTRVGEGYKASDYMQVTGISQRQARRELAELFHQGLLEKQGKGPATTYVRTAKESPE